MQLLLYRFYTDNLTTTVGKLILSEKIYEYIDIEKLTLAQFSKLDNIFNCFTIELDWKNNQRNISCIPKGIYTVNEHTSKKFKETIIVNNVPNRSGILIHKGNSYKDIQGCILPVSKIEISDSVYGVNSKLAFSNIMFYSKQIKSLIIIDKINYDS